jgi:uncharacterized membrane protein (UPF0127 family)
MPVLFKKINGAALAAFVISSLLFMGLAHADMLFKRGHLKIETQHGPVMLDVEIADTEPKREQGLMFRQHLAANQGMLFLFDSEQEITMWMKNTYIPLDMVFIGRDWRIVNIAQNAEPLSTDIISSVQPASRVLEIAGGQAEKLGLKTGDRVTFQQ